MKRLALLLLTAFALAGGAGVGAMPMSGGTHGQGGSHHGFVHHRGFVHHGFDHRFDGHQRNFHRQGSVIIGVPIWRPPIYYAQPVYIVQRYWYYCNDPAGYYPSVQDCPQGWLRVIPSSPPQ